MYMIRKIRSLFRVETHRSEAKDDAYYAPKQLADFLQNGSPGASRIDQENPLTPAEVSVTRNILPLFRELGLDFNPEHRNDPILPTARKFDGQPEVGTVTLPDSIVYFGNYRLQVPTNHGLKDMSYGTVHWIGKSQTTLLPNGERQKGFMPSCAVYVLFDNNNPENRVASITVNNQFLGCSRQPITNIELQSHNMAELMRTITTGGILSQDLAEILVAETLAQAAVALKTVR